MYKIIGNYKYGAISPSDKTKVALGFKTKQDAEKHIENMNKALMNYSDNNSGWNKTFWSTEPEKWILIEL